MKPGRKSAAELAIAPVVSMTPRPAAPDHLTDAEAEVWERVVRGMAPDYFRAADQDQLANLCRHVVSARRISAWIEKVLSGEDRAEIADFERLTRMRAKETASANALARSLRLTKQATVSPKGANGKAVQDGARPWDKEPLKEGFA